MTRTDLIKLLGPSLLERLEVRGLRVVPVEATQGMMIEGGQVLSGYVVRCGDKADDVWSAMLAASPFAPEPEDKG